MPPHRDRRLLEAALILVLLAVVLVALMATVDSGAPIVIAIPL